LAQTAFKFNRLLNINANGKFEKSGFSRRFF